MALWASLPRAAERVGSSWSHKWEQMNPLSPDAKLIAGGNTEKEGIALLPQHLTAEGVWLVEDGAGGGWRSFFSMDHLGFPKLRVTLSISFQPVSLLP